MLPRSNSAHGHVHVVLISTYDMGRQPFGVASPAAWLHEAGAPVTCMDLAIERLDERAVARADLIAFYVPMHLAGRLAASVAAGCACSIRTRTCASTGCMRR